MTHPSATAAPPPMSAEQAREETAYAAGVQAYLWGLPLYEYGRATPQSLNGGGVAVNDFRRLTTLRTAIDRFVASPNDVTVDAYAVWNACREPVVVFIPKLAVERWYLVQIGDFFDEVVHDVGGTKGSQPGVYVITAPDYDGPVPGGMTRLAARTRMGVAAVRIFVQGDADLPGAVSAQRGFRMMPLSAYLRDGLAYAPVGRAHMEPATQDAPAELRYFEALGYWMQRFLATSADADALVASFRRIGLSVARGFDWRSLDEATTRGLARAAGAAERIVDATWCAAGETTNGWRYTPAGRRAGHDLALRAALARYVAGAQLSDQVICPDCGVDDNGEPLDGRHDYVLHFDELPPVSVFWNLAMYDGDMLFVENGFGRYSVGSTTDGVKYNPDGSLTLYLQHDPPADPSTWLPAPAGPFSLTMRFYGPLPSVLDGSYRLPAVRRV